MEHVAEGMDRLRVGGYHRVGEGLGRQIVDDDRRGRATCGLGMVRRHHGDRFSHVPDDVPREDGLVGIVEPVGLAAGHVVRCEHRLDTGDRKRPGHVDAADRRRRVRGAHDVAPEHAFGVHV